jgi:hypothetical protein
MKRGIEAGPGRIMFAVSGRIAFSCTGDQGGSPCAARSSRWDDLLLVGTALVPIGTDRFAVHASAAGTACTLL